MKTIADIMQAAATEIGNAGHHVPGDGSSEAFVSDLNWCGILEAELESYHYAFSREWKLLESKVGAKFNFGSAFQMPENAIIARDLYEHEPDCGFYEKLPRFEYNEWEESDCVIHIDDCRYICRHGCPPDKVWLEYTRSDVPVSRMGANFKLGLKYRLAAVYARSLAMETGDAERFEAQADHYFRIARIRSGRRHNGTEIAPKNGRLAKARMTRRYG